MKINFYLLTNKSKFWFGGFILLLVALGFAYLPALHAPFYFDTVQHLKYKPILHLTTLDFDSLNQAIRSKPGGSLYRPVSYLSLALTYYFFRLQPEAYHVGNFFIHAFSSLALWFMFSSLLCARRIRAAHPLIVARAKPFIFLTVALWALHPIQTNVVIYDIQRMASLAGLFVFLCVGCYARLRESSGRRAALWGFCCIATFGLAIGSKENSIILFPLLYLIEWLLFSKPESEKYRKTRFYICCSILLVGGLYVATRYVPYLDYFQQLYDMRNFSFYERLLTQARLQFWYLFILLIPDARVLSLDAHIPLSHGLLSSPETLAAVLALFGAVCLAILNTKKRPLLSLGIFWFLIAQSVEATFLPLEIYFEHRMYIPSVFFFATISSLVIFLHDRFPRKRVFGIAAMAAILGFMLYGVSFRSAIWADPLEFYLDAVAKAPDKARTHVSLGGAFLSVGLFDEAQVHLNKALELGGEDYTANANLAIMEFRRGNPKKAEELFLRAAKAGNPDQSVRALLLAAQMLSSLDENQKALSYAERALLLDSNNSEVWVTAGNICVALGNTERAEKAFKSAIYYNGTLPEPWVSLAKIHVSRRNYAAAKKALEAAYRLDPRNPGYPVVLKQVSDALEGKAGVPDIGNNLKTPSPSTAQP